VRHRPTACLILGATLVVGACGATPPNEGWTFDDAQPVADRSSPSAPSAPSARPWPSPSAVPLSARAPSSATVRIADFAFGPATVTVAAGGRVEWTNADGDRHSILLDGTESERLETGATHAREFSAPGEFSYVCGLHPSMTGTVVVAAPGEGAATPAGGGSGPAAAPVTDPHAQPSANPTPTSSPDDDDGRDDRDDHDRDDHDRDDHDRDDHDRDDDDHSGPGGGGSGHG
jgi:plastocyanin